MAKYNEGRYWVKVVRQSMGKSKEKGTPLFQLDVEVQGAINPNDPDGDLVACDRYERSIVFYLTEKTIDFVLEDLELLGFAYPSFKYLDPATPDFCNFKDKEFEAFCEHERNDDKTYERWRVFKKRAAKQPEEIESSEMRKLDTLFGKQLSKFKKSAAPQRSASVEGMGVPAEQTRSAMAAQAPGDDIPF